jgi:hypothetical protein
MQLSLRIALALLQSVVAFGSALCAPVICRDPAPELSRQRSNNTVHINGETVTFFFKSQSYPVDIYSAYAPQGATPEANYCIRYEAINKGQSVVEKFYWPLPGIQMDYLDRTQNMSVVMTTPPGRPPVVDETRVYAFLNEIIRTFAYQKRADISPFNHFTAKNIFTHQPQIQLAALEPTSQIFQLKEPTKYPDVGAEFSSNDIVISASSRAEWDGRATEIRIEIDRVSSKFEVIAPVTYAFFKGSTSAEVLALARGGRNEQLPFFETPERFTLTRKLSPQEFAKTQSLYVIEQPVTIVGSNGRICFMAPMYSPMPFPSELLSCNLFR